ncbi:MAG: glycoside hydrolase family 88 protein [Spirochaetes bacterium]|nr:glycoside hydrolase family 88 protein [Spirochaetota bacterium]
MSEAAERPPRAANGFPTVGLLLADLHTGSSRSLWPAVAALGRLATALAGFQDRQSRLWFQVADQPDRAGNFPEVSATCMFAAALAKASRLGLLEGDRWLTSARAAVAAVEERFLSHGLDGVATLDGTSAIVGLGGRLTRRQP